MALLRRHRQLAAGQGLVVGGQLGLVHALLKFLGPEVLGPDDDPRLLDERVAMDDAVPEGLGELGLLGPGDEFDIGGGIATPQKGVAALDRGADNVSPRPAPGELFLVCVEHPNSPPQPPRYWQGGPYFPPVVVVD